MVYYNALFMKYGYRMNPFEIPAYDQEFRFLDYCEKHGYHAISSEIKAEALKKISKEGELIFTGHEFKYNESYILLSLSFIFCLLVTLFRPLADLLVFVIISLVPPVKVKEKHSSRSMNMSAPEKQN